jgi:hypothetical protein
MVGSSAPGGKAICRGDLRSAGLAVDKALFLRAVGAQTTDSAAIPELVIEGEGANSGPNPTYHF